MIIVRVELHHSSEPGRVTEIARAEICNDGTGTPHIGNYRVRTLRGRGAAQLAARRTQRDADVKGFARKASHIWNLVHQALTAMGYGRAVPRPSTSGASSTAVDDQFIERQGE